MLRYILLLCCLMISNLLYSQTGYPKLIVYNGDTVVAISRHQMQMLNIAHVTWESCTEENDSLRSIVDTCIEGFHAADSIISIQHSMILADEKLMHQQEAVVDTLTSAIKDQKKVIKKLRIQKGLMGVFDGILVGLIAYLLIHG